MTQSERRRIVREQEWLAAQPPEKLPEPKPVTYITPACRCSKWPFAHVHPPGDRGEPYGR